MKETTKRTAKALELQAGLMTMLAINGGLEGKAPEENKAKKCLLPGCDKETKHNGGYCCGAHCKEHRRIKGLPQK